jgi:uncharacterized OB-fold protein
VTELGVENGGKSERRNSWRSAGKLGRRFLRERERGENLGGKCANGANYFSVRVFPI